MTREHKRVPRTPRCTDPMTTELKQVTTQADAFEWPTWLLWLTIWAGWLALVLNFEHLPLWFSTPLLVVLCAWYMSFQHELTHGHPTRSAAINRLLGLAPLAVWYPYDTYKVNHLKHHDDARLTEPGVDPESNYVPRAEAQHLSGLGRWLKTSQRTVLGRVVVGPALVILDLIKVTVRGIFQGDFSMPKVWAVHLPILLLLLWGLERYTAVSALYYCCVVGYFAVGLAMVRSLYEHRPDTLPAHRTVINEAALFWRLLYLNNNYHVVHHNFPGIPWYRIPAMYRADAAGYQARNNGFVVPGYFSLLRKNLWTPVDSAVLEEAQDMARERRSR